MTDNVKWLPDAHFTGVGKSIDPSDEIDNDEQLPETPADVVMMLGFDPALEDDDESTSLREV